MRSIRTRCDALAWMLACAAAALLLTPLACRQELAAPLASEESSEGSPRRGGVLRLASMGDVRNLDPAGPTDGLAQEAQHLLFAIDFKGAVRDLDSIPPWILVIGYEEFGWRSDRRVMPERKRKDLVFRIKRHA